jgi:hypothetical protein
LLDFVFRALIRKEEDRKARGAFPIPEFGDKKKAHPINQMSLNMFDYFFELGIWLIFPPAGGWNWHLFPGVPG